MDERSARVERILLYMFGALLALSVIAIIALIVGGPTKSGAIWTAVALLPAIGIPLSLLLLISLVILNGVRRGRAAKGARK
ncbi:MAG: hypothetical protein JWR35_3659 [Marmoricola sp.]|nr:hypothetical protein [Marmoricola sp.]